MLPFMASNNLWTRIKREHGLYRYNPSGQYFARVRFHGKLYRRKLETDDLGWQSANCGNSSTIWSGRMPRRATRVSQGAGRLFRDTQRRGIPSSEQRSVIAKLRDERGSASTHCRCARSSLAGGRMAIEALRSMERKYYNSALTVIRDAFDLAVADQRHPGKSGQRFEIRKRKQPIRQTPTFEQFRQIVADIRAQRFNADAQESGDFVEFLGLAWTRES